MKLYMILPDKNFYKFINHDKWESNIFIQKK